MKSESLIEADVNIKEYIMDCLAKYELIASKVEVFEDKVVFTHKGIGPISNASHICGTKTVFISDITSVNFKHPAFLSPGYLQVNFPGKTFVGNPLDGDEFSIPVGLKKYIPDAENVLNCINRLVEQEKKRKMTIESAQDVSSATSISVEILKLKELYDSGIITDEEFQQGKQLLLKQ